MLIFISVLVSFIIFGVLTNIFIDRDSVFMVPSVIGFCILTIVIIFVMSTIIINTINAPSETAQLNAEYDVIMHQLDNIKELYGESLANDKKALYDEVKKWNKEIARKRVLHKNLWTNWLFPIDYNQFKLIELTN